MLETIKNNNKHGYIQMILPLTFAEIERGCLLPVDFQNLFTKFPPVIVEVTNILN